MGQESSPPDTQAPVYRGPDRRRRPTPRLSRFTFWGGRRKQARRAGERETSFVDQYDIRLWLIVLWVSLMNIADSFFTLVHLQNGGIEANPFAAALLETGRTGFVLWKCGLISAALVVLVIHKNFLVARAGLKLSIVVYTGLCLYHLALFWV